VTSRYDGTALIAAAHLGHAEVVRTLIRAGAPLDHVNNLGWTALIESIVLGDGSPRHTDTLAALLEAGANVNLPDRNGRTPLALAQARGYAAMVERLRRAGAVSGPALDRQLRRQGRAARRPRLGHRRHASRGTAAPPGSAPPGRAPWKASAATGTYPPPGGRLGWHPDCSPALAVRTLQA